uniref:Uncharacterized protein n=1 Tax=Fagus sylvatica TaxID=28930 RepID=A0A2N9I002_FAGSY
MAPKKSFGEGPKKRQKSKAQEEETAIMDSAFRSFEDLVKLDLVFYIAWHMDTCVKKKNAALPYSFHITSILEKFEINLSGERETRKVLPSDVYGTTTMKQMRYILRENIWVKKDAIVEEEIDEVAQMEGDGAQGNEDAMHEDEEPPIAPPMASSSSHTNGDNF